METVHLGKSAFFNSLFKDSFFEILTSNFADVMSDVHSKCLLRKKKQDFKFDIFYK